MRHDSLTDHCIGIIDKTLQSLLPIVDSARARSNPSFGLPEAVLTPAQQRQIVGYMRVNHAGEVSAQALYQGQALAAKRPALQAHLRQAAAEEIDHLAWCEERLHELNATTSLLNPLWYSASFLLGVFAGLAGDKISLGFLAETERQVTRHLQKHLYSIPEEDRKTRAILKQMIFDENQHALSAIEQGGRPLPKIIQVLMHWGSKLLTTSSYYL